jgi:hypothetical protein
VKPKEKCCDGAAGDHRGAPAGVLGVVLLQVPGDWQLGVLHWQQRFSWPCV